MLRGNLLRPLIAILVMAFLLAPTTICLKHSHHALCPCCEQDASMQPSLEGPCCLVRPTQPAVPTAMIAFDAAPALIAEVFLQLPVTISAQGIPPTVHEPPFTPPPGAFALRI